MHSLKIPPRRWLGAIASFAVAVVVTCEADTVQYTSGQSVTGTISKYGNGTFEMRAADGKIETIAASRVNRIQFDQRSVPTKIVSRNKGALEGTVTSYESGGFMFNGGSAVEKLPGIFVDRVTFGGDRGKEVEVISRGQKVDIAKHLVLGNVTIIDYYADWCGPCKEISPALEQIVKSDPEVALRKVDIINWASPVAKQYSINSIPRIEIYNRTGKLVGTVKGSSAEEVKKYVSQAKTGG